MTDWTESSDAAIALAYDGVTSAEHWYGALDAFRVGVDATFFHWIEADAQGGSVTRSLVSHEAPVAKADEYNAHHAAGDLRLQAGLGLAGGEFMLDHEHFDSRTRSRHPIYADWLPSVGLYHTLGMMLRKSGHSINFYAALRAHDAPPFDDKARQFADRVAPHLARAQALRHRLVELEMAARPALAALDALAHGVWVTDAQARVLQANTAAVARMQSGGPVDAQHGRLCMREAVAHDAWLQHLAAAVHGPQARAGSFGVPGPGGTLHFTVLPLHADHPITRTQARPLALLVLAPPAGAGLPSVDQLAALLNLTPAEARLALHLAMGHTVIEFAAASGSSPHTARTHMRNLLRKTQMHRQADVVRLVQSLHAGG
ncbi:MAG: helix-turn-helix transcriptional regulator [Comamonadaceae bacterium]|nr:MAG: helix-turn-helix transcriptional regulator [Comamonadaceae bacterium]